jgi:ATP-dependent DNA ligase
LVKVAKPETDGKVATDEVDKLLSKKFSAWVAEPKLDGERVLVRKENDKITLVRENDNVKNTHYPELVEYFSSLESLPNNTILDGEVCVLENEFHANFNHLLNRQTTTSLKQKLLLKQMPVSFVGFDILKFDGEDLTRQEFDYRRSVLESSGISGIMKQFKPTEIHPMIEKFRMEGVVVKNRSAKYYENRAQIKLKAWEEKDFKVTGFTSNSRLISALTIEDFDGNDCGKVNYTGYPDTEEWAKRVTGMIAVVRYLKFTDNTGNKLKFPVLKELREVN